MKPRGLFRLKGESAGVRDLRKTFLFPSLTSDFTPQRIIKMSDNLSDQSLQCLRRKRNFEIILFDLECRVMQLRLSVILRPYSES